MWYKKIQIIIVSLVVFCSCQGIDRPEKPDNLINRETMEDILYDVTLVNASRTNYTGDMLGKGIEPDRFVYEKYGIDSLQLAQSLAYYSIDFNGYIEIWETVQERLEYGMDSIKMVQGRRDSIFKIDGQRKRDSLAAQYAKPLEGTPTPVEEDQ